MNKFKRVLRWMRGRRGRRGFDGARIGRLYNDWTVASKKLDADIQSGLNTLRARSRDLCINNDYGRRFMWLLKTNVIGPKGIELQSRVKMQNGRTGQAAMDAAAIEKIEDAWLRFGEKKNCTVSRQLTMKDVQDLFVQGAARDGEFIIRMVGGFDNEFGFALQIIEPDYLDHTYDDSRQNIKMGIEFNKWREPIFYHISKNHPNDADYVESGLMRQRVPAKDILHIYIHDRADQSRGYPWTATALRRLYMLGHYEESELIASRVGAAKMGFFQQREGASYSFDDTDSDGNLITEVSPGKFEKLPAGYEFKAFDADHPNAGFDAFTKSILRGAAAGLNVSYNGLSGDRSDVNYSSLRHGELTDRDIWMLLQEWTVENLMAPVFSAWLPWAIASKQVALNMRDIERWESASWRPRRWSWVDPRNDMLSNKEALSMRVTSRRRIAAQQGNDYDEVAAELKEEETNLNGSSDNDQDNQNQN